MVGSLSSEVNKKKSQKKSQKKQPDGEAFSLVCKKRGVEGVAVAAARRMSWKEKGIRRPVRSLPPELVGSTHRKGPVEAVEAASKLKTSSSSGGITLS